MIFSIERDLVMGVYGPQAPTDEEWEEYLEALKQQADNPLPVLTVSDGGGPNAVQRRKLIAMYTKEQGERARIAVVTDTVATYGIVTAISWFSSGIKAFKTPNFEEALSYLGVEPARFAFVQMRIRMLRRTLGLPPTF
jgi:hypothetical protein